VYGAIKSEFKIIYENEELTERAIQTLKIMKNIT
jgi:hypothetical protein